MQAPTLTLTFRRWRGGDDAAPRGGVGGGVAVVAYRVAMAWGQKERELPGRQLPRSGTRSIAAGALLCALPDLGSSRGLGLDDSRPVYSGGVDEHIECVPSVQRLRFLAIDQ